MEVFAQTDAGRQGRQQVGHGMLAEHGQLHLATDTSERHVQLERGLLPLEVQVARANVRGVLDPEGQHPCPGASTQGAAPGIVGIENDPAIRADTRGQSALLPGHALFTPETGQMGSAHVGHDGAAGLRRSAESLNLPRGVGPHLDHQGLTGSPGAEQGVRHTDVVVVRSRAGNHLAVAAQKVGKHVLGRGLAAGAGDAHHGHLQPRAVPGRQPGERQARVGAQNHGNLTRGRLQALL